MRMDEAGSERMVHDYKLNKDWRLEFVKIHHPVRQYEKDGKTIYFACSDFQSLDGEEVLDILEMKNISLINESEMVERILRHLGLRKQHPPTHENRAKMPTHGPPVTEDFHDGRRGYEESCTYRSTTELGCIRSTKVATGVVCQGVCPDSGSGRPGRHSLSTPSWKKPPYACHRPPS